MILIINKIFNLVKGHFKKPDFDNPIKDEEFKDFEIERYKRQITLKEIGEEGQKKIMKAKVLVIGCGGLGSPCVLYLCSCGIKNLTLVDNDSVEMINLHRQVIHNEDTIGINKALSAKMTCDKLDKNFGKESRIKFLNLKFNSENGLKLVSEHDIIVDCSDNVETRFLINDACVLMHKPLVSGSSVRLDGQLSVYNYGEDCPCYRCININGPPPQSTLMKCAKFGILGVVPGIMGCLMAQQVFNIILSLNEGILSKKLLIFNAKSFSFKIANLRKRQEKCPVCGKSPTITSLKEIKY